MQKQDCMEMLAQSMDCCNEENESSVAGVNSGHAKTPQSGHGQPSGGCGCWSACGVAAAVAVAPAVRQFAFVGRSSRLAPYIPLQYISFIAEGLQRPPSIPA
jgi:hypothetical protein